MIAVIVDSIHGMCQCCLIRPRLRLSSFDCFEIGRSGRPLQAIAHAAASQI